MFVAEFREDIRIIIPIIAERVKDPYHDVCNAAIKGVSKLMVQGTC
jgi:hypothetical protein